MCVSRKYPFLPGCPICGCIVDHTNLMVLFTSVESVVMSLISFLIVCISFLSVYKLSFSLNATSGTSLVAQLRIHLPGQETQV